MNKKKIESIVKRVVNETLKLNEEKGINDSVVLFTNATIKRLRTYANKESYKEDENGFRFVSGSFESMMGREFHCTVEFIVYRFIDKEEYNRFMTNPNARTMWMATTVQSEDKIVIHTYTICGKYDVGSLYDSVQHEAEHLFQHFKSGTQLLKKKENFYETIMRNLYSRDNNGWNKRLAIVGYLSFNEERCAFVNGMYAYIMQSCKNIKMVEQYADQSEAAQYLDYLGEIESLLQESSKFEGLKEALEEFKPRDYKWFKENSTRIYDKFLNQFNKAVDKARIDMMQQLNKGDFIINTPYK